MENPTKKRKYQKKKKKNYKTTLSQNKHFRKIMAFEPFISPLPPAFTIRAW